MAPLRTPYDFDDEGNATSTSTTEPSSSGFRSSITSRYTTEDGTDTLGDEDTSAPGRLRPSPTIERLSNHHDYNDNVKNTIDFMSKTTALHVHHAF